MQSYTYIHVNDLAEEIGEKQEKTLSTMIFT